MFCIVKKKYVKVNDEKAFHYFSLAAEQKHKNGLFNVGYSYYIGRGVKKTLIKQSIIFHWLLI